MENKIRNEYLELTNLGDKVEINYEDLAFAGYSTVGIDDLGRYCDEKSETWLNSNLGNFDRFTKNQRKKIAEKWQKVKNMPYGKHNYYFNIETAKQKKELLIKEVETMAKIFGIKKYKLTFG